MTILHHAHQCRDPYHRPLARAGRSRIRGGKTTQAADRFCPVHGYYPACFGTCPRCGR